MDTSIYTKYRIRNNKEKKLGLEILLLITLTPRLNNLHTPNQKTRRIIILRQLTPHPRPNTLHHKLVKITVRHLHKSNQFLFTSTHTFNFLSQIFQSIFFTLTAAKIVIIIHHLHKTSTHTTTETF